MAPRDQLQATSTTTNRRLFSLDNMRQELPKTNHFPQSSLEAFLSPSTRDPTAHTHSCCERAVTGFPIWKKLYPTKAARRQAQLFLPAITPGGWQQRRHLSLPQISHQTGLGSGFVAGTRSGRARIHQSPSRSASTQFPKAAEIRLFCCMGWFQVAFTQQKPFSKLRTFLLEHVLWL